MYAAINPQLAIALQQASASAASGQFSDAERHYRWALTLAPDDPRIAISLGLVLRQMQRPAEAKMLFSGVVQRHPALAEAHYGLGLACQDMMELAGAEAAYRAALAHNPGFLPAALGLASVCNFAGRPDEALDLLKEAATPDPRLAAAIEHQRGNAQQLKDQNEAALAHFERALALEPGLAGAAQSRATALQSLGRDEEALAALRQVLKDNPADLMAHDTLNRMLYRLKRDDEFLRSYDEAAAKFPPTPHFALAKAALLVRSERHAEALELYDYALKLAPGEPVVLQGRAMAQLGLKQVEAAIASYEEGLRRAPDDINMLTSAAAAYLTGGAPKKAEAAALRALKLAPAAQSGLALLGTAWRLMGDAREHDLHRYDDFIQVFDLEPPAGFSDMTTFCGELDRWLDTQHSDKREHIDQTLRGGTQTMGNFLSPGRNPLLDGLRQRIEEAVRRYVAGLPQDEHHPFLRWRAPDVRFAGSWSSRLKDRGFHVNHLHSEGWISSAFYVAVPETVHDLTARQGWIKFGEPSFDIGLDDPVRRAVQPRVGRLVLFPSYTWHGTVPFHAPQNRTTIAFDAVPANDRFGRA